MLSLCVPKTILPETYRQLEARPALLKPMLTSVSTPAYDPKEGLIKLDVVVTDKGGKPVSGISAKDFTLLDNGQPEKILTFHAFDASSIRPDPPVKVILLVDTLNLPERLVSYERREVNRFLRQNNGHLASPVSLEELSNEGLLTVGQPSADGNALAADFAHNRNIQWVHGVSGGMREVPVNARILQEPESGYDTRVGSYNMPSPLRRKSPHTGETEIAIRRMPIICTRQLHSYRDNRYLAVEANMLLRRPQPCHLEDTGSVSREIALFAKQLPKVVGEDQLRC